MTPLGGPSRSSDGGGGAQPVVAVLAARIDQALAAGTRDAVTALLTEAAPPSTLLHRS